MNKFISTLIILSCVALASFNIYAGECGFVKPQNWEQGKDIGGFDKDAAIEKGEKDTQNPLGVLTTCVFATVTAGMNPKTVIEESGCACIEAVKKFCRIDSKGILRAKGGATIGLCIPLAPVVLGSFKL